MGCSAARMQCDTCTGLVRRGCVSSFACSGVRISNNEARLEYEQMKKYQFSSCFFRATELRLCQVDSWSK